LGLAGAAWLGWSQFGAVASPGNPFGIGLSVLACAAAPLMYGIAANLSRRRLAGVPPLAGAAGSQASAAIALALPAWWAWPATAPSAAAWGAAAALSLACTALAYVLYFRLIANAGAMQATTVTFLIPAFAMAWGWLVLGERADTATLVGTAVILAGTALATGVVALPARPRSAARPDDPAP
jgi:drug/metabolite transporter (DMT)-like permease